MRRAKSQEVANRNRKNSRVDAICIVLDPVVIKQNMHFQLGSEYTLIGMNIKPNQKKYRSGVDGIKDVWEKAAATSNPK